jgi:hypothetical protein
MAKKEQTLTCTFFVGGKQVDKLTEEQCERIAQRLSETMSRYYTANPEEYREMKSN